MNASSVVLIALAIFVVLIFISTIKIVPQRSAFIIERLGKYRDTLLAGFHIIVPYMDRIAYKHTLKEQAIDVASQICITRDNISVEVDGILYLQVMDPKKPLTELTITVLHQSNWHRQPCVVLSAKWNWTKHLKSVK